MFYKKFQNQEGNYKDKNNVRFTVLEVHEAYTPQGKNVGWDEFENKEAALAAYGLTYSPIPEDQKMQYVIENNPTNS